MVATTVRGLTMMVFHPPAPAAVVSDIAKRCARRDVEERLVFRRVQDTRRKGRRGVEWR